LIEPSREKLSAGTMKRVAGRLCCSVKRPTKDYHVLAAKDGWMIAAVAQQE